MYEPTRVSVDGCVSSLDPREEAARLYREYGPAVYRRCLRLLGEREAARDATQEVFVRLLHEIGKLEDRGVVLSWIYRVATNHCLNLLRDSRRRGEQQLGATLDVTGDACAAGYPERHLAREVLSRFDAQTQAVAIGILVDGMEQEELAGALGISRRTIQRKLDRFLQNARKFLARSER